MAERAGTDHGAAEPIDLDMLTSNGGPPVMTCPRCDSRNVCGHVEHDRIAWWSCDDCDAEWPRGSREITNA